MKTAFRFWVGVSLVLVYGVIAAGAIVDLPNMVGSYQLYDIIIESVTGTLSDHPGTPFSEWCH